jgi:hypothetical protein
LKGTHTGTIPARFGLIWFSGFRGEDLNVIFYHNNHILSLVIAPIILDYILHCDCSFGYRNSIKGRTTFGISRLNNDVTQ